MDNSLGEILSSRVSASGQKAFGNEKNYQPVSRILFPRWCGRSSFIWSLHYCRGSSCLPSGAAPCGASGGPPSIAGIRGISACKVYPPRQLPAGAVGSYPTFSTSPPLPAASRPARREGSYFLWHYLWTRERPPALNRYIALRCPDFPPPAEQGAMTRLVAR